MTTHTAERDWRGVEVAITGRLASMSRDEAVKEITAVGASFAHAPGGETAVLVIGQGGPPLGEDGRLTKSLQTARDLKHSGVAIDILPEEEFLAQLGLHDRREELNRLYTTAQLGRILNVPASRIRTWMRHDLIRPAKVVRRLSFFDFQQVATARMLSQLTSDGVTPQRIRKSLEALSDWLPRTEISLAQLESLEQDVLVVRTDDGQLAETSGQLRMDFEPAPEPKAPLPTADRSDSETWFEAGVSYEEEGRLADAVRSYEQALKAGGGARPEVYFNLGNALFSLDEKSLAAHRFGQATELEPEYVEAWNNLGNTLSDLGKPDAAVAAFRRALELEPDYADAHFNLAETIANMGEYEEARKHWRAYLELDPVSSWADVVRERLRRTSV